MSRAENGVFQAALNSIRMNGLLGPLAKLGISGIFIFYIYISAERATYLLDKTIGAIEENTKVLTELVIKIEEYHKYQLTVDKYQKMQDGRG
jgi:hypothetical protein